MNKFFILLTIVFGVGTCFFGCCENDCPSVDCYCSEKGIILGIDNRDCYCCGGWYIQIGNDTLRAPVLPVEFQQGLGSDEFPLPVYLEWALSEEPCLGDEIVVECIRRQD